MSSRLSPIDLTWLGKPTYIKPMPNIFAIVVEQESGETEQNMGQLEQKYCLFSSNAKYGLIHQNFITRWQK